ncbi:MAG: flagellar hook-length control protein FliK [Pseudomonadota bacterium]
MQILLTALIAETSEGKKPASLVELKAENQTLFTEVFDLEEESGETALEGELSLPKIQANTEKAQYDGDLIEGDILLPEIPRAAPPPAPTVTEIAQQTTENLVVDDALAEAIDAPEADPQLFDAALPVAPREAPTESPISNDKEGFALPAASVEPERKPEIANKNDLPPPKRAITVPLATIEGSQSTLPQRATPGSDTFLKTKAPDLEAVERSARFVTVETIERQGPRDVQVPIARPQNIEISDRKNMAKSDPEKALQRTDGSEFKTTQITQNTAPAATIQTTAVAAPLVQPLMQNEKGHQRDVLPGSDAITAAATNDGDSVQQTVTSTTRADIATRPIVSQVVQLAFRAAVDGVVEVRLQPEELGRVRIAMTQMEAGVAVQISAERPETLDLLRRNIDMLERDLREQGFENLSFSFGEGSTDTEQHKERTAEFSEASKLNTHVDVDVHPEQMIVNDGRLDIRL